MNTSDNNVVRPFAKRTRQQVAPDSTIPPIATWEVASIRNPLEDQSWFYTAVSGKAYEGIAVSLWTHHANLRAATEKLAQFITTQWPGPDGRPLVNLAIERAAERADASIKNKEAFEGRLVGVYLFGLLSVVDEIARLSVVGTDADGNSHRWPHFAVPLCQWAADAGIKTVSWIPLAVPPSDFMLQGLRTHMLARLANPVDAGYLAKHAAHG